MPGIVRKLVLAWRRFGRVENVKIFSKKHWVEVRGESKGELVGGGLVTFEVLEAALNAKKALENTVVRGTLLLCLAV